MSNAYSGALILAVIGVGLIYYFDIGEVDTHKKENTLYSCVEKGTTKIYFSKRIVKGDNCSPASYINLNPDLMPGIRE